MAKKVILKRLLEARVYDYSLNRNAFPGEPLGAWWWSDGTPVDQKEVNELLTEGLIAARIPWSMQNCEEAVITAAGRAAVAAMP